jgi:hypothetical protein
METISATNVVVAIKVAYSANAFFVSKIRVFLANI